MSDVNRLYCSNNDVIDLCGVVVDKIKQRNIKVDVVYGVARGGVVPAYYISRMLGCEFRTFYHQTRDGTKQESIQRINNVLIVDDINDTGETLRQLVSKYKHNNTINFASLIRRHSSQYDTDITGIVLNNEDWVVFPWEELDDYKS